MSKSELGMNLDEMAEATAAFKAEEVDSSSPANMSVEEINESVFAEELVETAGELAEDVEVEDSDFWGNEPTVEEIAGKEIPEVAEITEIPGSDRIFKYKANGQDIELDLSTEEGRKSVELALSKAGGMDKAFSDLAKLKKQLKKSDTTQKELKKYQESWKQLEDLKNDRQKLLEFVTGESYSDFMNAELSKRQTYELGTEEEKRAMDLQDRIEAMERATKRDSDTRERELAEARQLRQDADYEKWNSWSQNELNKYVDQIPSSNQVHANKLKKALWRESIADVKGYYNKYGKITQKMVNKAFKDNADALLGLYSSEVETGVEKAIETKKVQAKEKAQIASTKNYDKSKVSADLSSLAPDKLFELIRKSKGY